MRPGRQWISAEDVDHDSPAKRQIESPWQRCERGMRLDLKLVTREHDSIEAQTGHADEHRGPRAVLEHEAHPLLLRAQARHVGKSLREIPRYLGSRSSRWKGRRDTEEQLGTVDLAPGHRQRRLQPVVALGLQRQAQGRRAHGRLERGRNLYVNGS